ncbi:hypothetical protein [Crateriforma conspicua]|uniref:Secreted protein n=1 Tax=Crateriforma conspicua TaxID=2527996 RepID=A0A5C6FIR2_9PLAN|nr:hypothetical protein [Crateriforma conspicua]TWU59539.1 hypothetical protein V7x_55850 [Crateriforma conspicua]
MPRFTSSLLALAIGLTCTTRLLADSDALAVKPLDQAVLEFNAEWESARRQIDVPRLTVEEVVAAIRHDSDELSEHAEAIAKKIAETKTLPSGTKLSLRRRHFSNQTMSYVWNIALVIDKTWDDSQQTDDVSEPNRNRRGTPVETLLVRKRYLASQPRRAGQDLKPLDELLANSSR